MDVKYLAIEDDISVYERESAFWLSRNVSSIRVSSMSDGIREVAREKFLYIGINADNITYMPLLRLMRDVTTAPILIATTTYTLQEQSIALNNGADLFGLISENPNDNYDAVMACINRLNERAKQPKPDIEIVTYHDILISPSHHRAFIKDNEILHLTKNEMDALYYLTANRGQILSHEQLYSKISSNGRSEISSDNMYNTVMRLRKKIREVSHIDYIKTIRDVGYRLISKNEITT
jgi:DNA-binding response OmpR family regulator